MIPNSAFVTVGETRATMDKVARKTAPGAEFAVLRQGHFSKVVALVDGGRSPSARAAMERFAIAAYLATLRHENIYLGEEFPGIQYLAVHAALRRRKRIAMLVHNTSSKRRSLPLVTLGLGRFVDHFLCLSEASRRELVANYRVAEERVTVIGSRVDTDFFSPDTSVEPKRQVCAAGAVNRDYATLIEAVRPLGVTTKIAADTAWKYSTALTTMEGIPPFVEMRSWGTYVNLRRLYAESAVVVVPLERAMLSGVTVALEAMAMGRPVILTHNRYVEDFLRDGENGFFVPGQDPAALRETIQYLLDHPDQAAAAGARAREWVLQRFTVARYVERIMSVWR